MVLDGDIEATETWVEESGGEDEDSDFEVYEAE